MVNKVRGELQIGACAKTSLLNDLLVIKQITKNWVYFDMRTYHIFSLISLDLVLLTPLFSLLYVIREVDSVLHRGCAKELAIHYSWCIAS